MKKIITLIIIFLLISIKINAQELSCKDFKVGKFYIPITEDKKKYKFESNDFNAEITEKRDLSIKKYIVIREKGTQIEWVDGIGNGNPRYEIIEWIDDCTYRLTYDSTKSELDKEKQWINDNNGIIVSKTKIENNCLYYTATMTTNDGQKISQDGIICKE